MDKPLTEMIDLVFVVGEGMLPANYTVALWAALLGRVPEFAQQPLIGILPLRGTVSGDGLWLSGRAKLTLRIPTTLVDQAVTRLTGQSLDVAEYQIQLKDAKTRSIQSHPTIHAQLVAGDNDEIVFTEHINTTLRDTKIKGKLICGKRQVIGDGPLAISGYSLVIHDLKPEASLQLQYTGLGGHRQLGCGIFVPYKVISGLGDD